jgi:hypothetical protein
MQHPPESGIADLFCMRGIPAVDGDTGNAGGGGIGWSARGEACIDPSDAGGDLNVDGAAGDTGSGGGDVLGSGGDDLAGDDGDSAGGEMTRGLGAAVGHRRIF